MGLSATDAWNQGRGRRWLNSKHLMFAGCARNAT